jgi:multidrug efflux pump subunit AcrB
MTPMLCAKFLKPKEDKSQKSKEPYSNKFYRSYRRGLIKMLKHPIMTLIAVFIIFMVAMQGFSLVPAMFMPPNDRPVFTAEFTYPIGTSIETTRQFAIELDEFIKNELQINEERNEGIINWSTHIGESAPRFNLSFEPEESSPGYCMCLLNASSSKVITAELMPKLEEFVENNFPSVRPRLALLGTGGGGGTPVEVRISGKNIDKLYEIVDSVKGKMRETPGTKNIYDNWGLREKKILVNIDQPRAYRAGLTSQDVAISLQTILSGMTVSQLREDDQTIPIMMRTEAVDRDNIEKLESYSINSQATGSSVPLKQIANLEVTWQPSKIIRWDRLKTISIRAGVEKNAEPLTISAELRTWLEEESKAWPLGYDYEIGGEAEESSEANQGIMDNLGIAAFIILMLLVMQFNSFRKPFIILVTIPLGLIGVVIGLIVARSYFGFMTLLGVVSLAGIVINNAIVLLDRIKIEIEENGHTPQTAIVEAGQRRMRPILLTTATTICGLIPLWLGGGPMWETMAIAIIFGLLFATALTLGVVPVLYSLFYKVKFKEYEYGK